MQHRDDEVAIDREKQRAIDCRTTNRSRLPSVLDVSFLDLGPGESGANKGGKDRPSTVQIEPPAPSPCIVTENQAGHALDMMGVGLDYREEGADFFGAAQCGGCGEWMPLERTAIEYHSRVCHAR